MRQATVVGHVVAEAKHAALERRKILVLDDGDGSGPVQLAIDGVGAGIGTRVIVSESGAAGADVTGLESPPVRSVVVGIIDEGQGAAS